LPKHTSISLYWKCQLIGWSVASLYWGYVGFLNGSFNFWIGALQFLSDISLYILITHLYRNFALRHHWQRLNLSSLLKRIIPAAIVLALAYLLFTSVKVYLFLIWLKGVNAEPFADFFRSNWLPMLMAGFRLMSIWLLAYHLYHYGRRESNLTKENIRLELVAKDAQLNSLSAQLNPHFLFNSLNTIKALVIESPKSARRAIDLLSDLLRCSLYSQKPLLWPIDDELALVNDYLELEKLRLEERLQFSVTCENGLDRELILRYSIQALVENAIKHGISNQKIGGLIAITIMRIGDSIQISVKNPGKLAMAAPMDGLGLKNLAERLSFQYKRKASFEIAEDQGIVSATILIPAV
jgi:sensor histidine kinase YesM